MWLGGALAVLVALSWATSSEPGDSSPSRGNLWWSKNDDVLEPSGVDEDENEDPLLPQDSSLPQVTYLPEPQVYVPETRPLRFQWHNCAYGRQGTLNGLGDAGFSRVPEQWSVAPDRIDKLYSSATVVVACNSREAAEQLMKDVVRMRPGPPRDVLVSTIVGVYSGRLCLGNEKVRQLQGRRKFAALFGGGCDFDALGIQPRQYIMRSTKDCLRLFADGRARPEKRWLAKPSSGSHGSGIVIFKDIADLQRRTGWWSQCNKSVDSPPPVRQYNRADYLVQEMVANAATVEGGFKFDVRTWLLVASLNPFIVFYSDGFARVAMTSVNSTGGLSRMAQITNAHGQEKAEGHFRTFAEVSQSLHRQNPGAFPTPDFMSTSFRKRAQLAMRYAALSQFTAVPRDQLANATGVYHLFACDW